jgi:membrane-bound ClpP family serine protease
MLDAKELWGIFGSSIVGGVLIIRGFLSSLPMPLLVIICVGIIIVIFVGISYIYSFIKGKIKRSLTKERMQTKSAIGGLIGHAGRGTKVRDSYFKGKITIKGTPKEVDVGSLIGRAEENTEVVDSSADAEIEYKQD